MFGRGTDRIMEFVITPRVHVQQGIKQLVLSACLSAQKSPDLEISMSEQLVSIMNPSKNLFHYEVQDVPIDCTGPLDWTIALSFEPKNGTNQCSI